MLQQALGSMDDHRAARTDVQLHMPQDSRDIHALQHGSISTRPEAGDWCVRALR